MSTKVHVRIKVYIEHIGVVLTELTQLVTNFSYCYENEMSLWCNKSPPILSDLGTAFKRVHNPLLPSIIKCQEIRIRE
jgi:HAUS augmin-like complex subunit 7